MASSNTDQSGSHAPSPPTTMHPELLMAACHGYYGQLTHLLDREGAAAVTSVASQVVVEIERSTSSAAALLLQGVTPDGDSALHIVATFGDDDKYSKSAEVIYYKAKHLLGACNKGNNTPLHCAARAGNVRMLSFLISLARGEEGGDGRVQTLVRTQNKLGETALHEAIRAAHMPAVDVLMMADPCLARVPDKGTSPLYLAVSLCHNGIARELYRRDNQLSYSGPEGQNALHAAVLRSKEMTELLLEWNKQLTKQQDQHGNTPLHFAVSLESDKDTMVPLYAVPVEKGKSITSFLNITEPPLELTKQILEVDAYSAFQPDKQGSFPIHVAASAGRLSAVIIFVTRYSGCAGLRDTYGRTFLHVAVKNKRYDIVAYACETPALSSILNKQDNEGNTALHQAVEVGDLWIFASLFANKQVDLNLPNNKQHTPLGLSINTIPTGLYCLLHPGILIQEALMAANATRDICRRDDDMQKEYSTQLASTQLAAEDAEKVISGSTQFLAVALVLIITMAFGATFALPGGYRADDHPDGGTPTLARLKEFQGFMMANALAFVCSSIAVLSLVFAGTPTVELPMRYRHYNISIWLSFNSIGSLFVAFLIAVYVMIAPVAASTSIAVIVVIVSQPNRVSLSWTSSSPRARRSSFSSLPQDRPPRSPDSFLHRDPRPPRGLLLLHRRLFTGSRSGGSSLPLPGHRRRFPLPFSRGRVPSAGSASAQAPPLPRKRRARAASSGGDSPHAHPQGAASAALAPARAVAAASGWRRGDNFGDGERWLQIGSELRSGVITTVNDTNTSGTVMASSNTDQSGSHAPSPPTTMHPELLMAACHGYYGQLTHLLDREGAAVTSVASQVVVEIERSTSSAASLLLQGVTPDEDSALHIVATFGDGDKYLKSAEVIYDKAKHLLGACNKGNNTPLHCAARAGNVAMLSLLINLARGEEGGDERVKTLVRTQNKLGETTLHEAIRAAHMPTVDVLMMADPCLARVPNKGTSPLFLAVSLCHNGIARELYTRDNQLSYSGPDGQNALHAAVLRSKEMTELLLGWNKHLTKQQDQHGNTPLHFAVSLESDKHGMLPLYAVPVEKGKSITSFLNITEPPLELTKQILEADAYSAYQPDKQGSFPIHVAASAGRLKAVIIFVTRYSGCAGLRDTYGRTFLHVAVKNKRYDIVAYACKTPALSSILNKQDNEGNTALHQAVEHPRILIQEALMAANATRDICRRDDDMQKEHSTQSAAEDAEKVISGSTQFLAVALVLIITMAFGATFALPGGYRADDHPDGGTPTLAGLKEFQGFMMANALAFVCSSIAVLSLVFAGTPTVELPMRYRHYNISIWLSLNAIGSLFVAFVIAVYVMIAPVAARTSIAVIVVIASVASLHSPSILEKFYKLLIVLYIRLGVLPILRSEMSKAVFLLCWPSIVIFGWQEYASRHQ